MTNDFDAARKLASWYANTNPKSPVVFNPHENLARCFLALGRAIRDLQEPSAEIMAEIENMHGPLTRCELHPSEFLKQLVETAMEPKP